MLGCTRKNKEQIHDACDVDARLVKYVTLSDNDRLEPGSALDDHENAANTRLQVPRLFHNLAQPHTSALPTHGGMFRGFPRLAQPHTSILPMHSCVSRCSAGKKKKRNPTQRIVRIVPDSQIKTYYRLCCVVLLFLHHSPPLDKHAHAYKKKLIYAPFTFSSWRTLVSISACN